MSKFYVVWQGRKTGIFRSWGETEKLVKSFPSAKFKSFKSESLARHAFEAGPDAWYGPARTENSKQTPGDLFAPLAHRPATSSRKELN